MPFKLGSTGQTVITDGPLIQATDLTDSDGGAFNTREGNLNLDLSTGNIFHIPNPGTNKARLKEKLTMSNFPTGNEIKKITVAFRGRGTPKTSPSLASLGTKTEWVGNWDWTTKHTWSHDGNYLFYTEGNSGYDYIRRISLSTPWDLTGYNNNNYDQNVRFDTNFISISRYTYIGNYGGVFFNDDGSKLYAPYFAGQHKIWTFSLSTPYDLTSTKTLIHTFEAATWTSDTSPNIYAPRFYSDGHVLMGVDGSGSPQDQAIAFYLETAYDLSTVYKSEYVTPSSGQPQRAIMNHNGDKLYVGPNGDNITYEHTLSTPFDISTISTSYNTYNLNHQPGANVGDSIIRVMSFSPNLSGTPDSYFWLGDQAFGTATDKFVRWETSTSFGSRPTLLWDSDRISMLNDSAPPMPGSGEYDLYEFLVFDSATGAKQTGFHNNVG
jgi:hypothetical protein